MSDPTERAKKNNRNKNRKIKEIVRKKLKEFKVIRINKLKV